MQDLCGGFNFEAANLTSLAFTPTGNPADFSGEKLHCVRFWLLIAGEIVDENGNFVAVIQTLHEGRGMHLSWRLW
jgi:hypothetical protein